MESVVMRGERVNTQGSKATKIIKDAAAKKVFILKHKFQTHIFNPPLLMSFRVGALVKKNSPVIGPQILEL